VAGAGGGDDGVEAEGGEIVDEAAEAVDRQAVVGAAESGLALGGGRSLCRRDDRCALLGSGGMAKAVAAALRDGGFRTGHVVARSETAGHGLAQQYGFQSTTQIGALRPRLIINATPIGMTGGPLAGDLSFPPEVVNAAETVFDVVAFPAQTPLITLATSAGKKAISGAEVIVLQAAEQFVLYTGIRPTDDQLRRAGNFSRG